MARLSQREELADLTSKLDAADKIIDSELRGDWEMRLENWRGKYWKDEPGVQGHRGAVNMTWGITNLMMAALYFRDPHVHVEAKRPGVKVDPRITERLMNYYIRELGLGREFKRAIKDALLFDAGYLKLGYEYEMEGPDLEPVTDDVGNELMNPSTGEPLLKNAEGDIYIERDGKWIQLMDKGGDLVPTEPEQPSLHTNIRKDQPSCRRWPPMDVLRDPEARYADLSDSRFIGFRSVVPLEMVKNNRSYKNTADLQATRQVRKELLESPAWDMEKKDKDTERVEIVEVFHKKWNNRKKRYDIWQSVIAKGHDAFLLHRESPFLYDEFPCEVLYFDEDPERPYGHSPLRAIDSQIETMNIARAQHLAMADQQLQKTIYNGQFISEEEAQKIANAPQGGVVKLENVPGDVSLQNVWYAVPVPQISQDIYLTYDRARDEIQILFGLNEYMMGGGGSGPKRQATEAGLIQQGFAVRVEEKRVAVANMVENTVEFLAAVLRQFGTYKQVFKITNEMGEEQWMDFQVSDAVSDELDYRIDAFESMFQAREIKIKEAQDRLNMLAPLAQILPINVLRLVEDYLRASGQADVAPYFNQPQPMQPQLPPGGGNGGSPFESQQRAGQVMDVEMLRQPAGVGAGNEGRAIG